MRRQVQRLENQFTFRNLRSTRLSPATQSGFSAVSPKSARPARSSSAIDMTRAAKSLAALRATRPITSTWRTQLRPLKRARRSPWGRGAGARERPSEKPRLTILPASMMWWSRSSSRRLGEILASATRSHSQSAQAGPQCHRPLAAVSVFSTTSSLTLWKSRKPMSNWARGCSVLLIKFDRVRISP